MRTDRTIGNGFHFGRGMVTVTHVLVCVYVCVGWMDGWMKLNLFPPLHGFVLTVCVTVFFYSRSLIAVDPLEL